MTKDSRLLKFAPERPLHVEWIILTLFVVVTVGFGVSYVRLMYEQHQAQGRLQAAERRLENEEWRQQELQRQLKLARTSEGTFVLQYVPRLLRRAAPGAEVWIFPEQTGKSPAEHGQPQPEVGTRANPPIWKRWLALFHLIDR